ncbi:MAG: HlyC/CorC family transporter [Dehalococcoidia bacterium]|nr:HlyC/CorC family transporter [Dehalococcoidia bacterium]
MENIPMSVPLALLAVCLVLSAFFSASEAAFLSIQTVRQARLRRLAQSKTPGASQVLELAQHPERLLSTVLLGNNLVNTAAAALGTAIAIQMLRDPDLGVIAATIVVTVLLLIFGESVPKTIATAHPERAAFLLWRPLLAAEWLLTPVGGAVHALARLTRRLVRAPSQGATISETDIRLLIALGQQIGSVEHTAAEMLEKVFRFGNRQVREVMTPRTEVLWVEQGTTLADFLHIYAERTHTRFPVHAEHTDNVIGILTVKDVMHAMALGKIGHQEDVTTLVRPTYFTPETKLISHLLPELQKAGHQMAIVIDEYGGTAGLVTLKHLVEEVVGRAAEEGAPLEEVRPMNQQTFKVDAGIRIDEANERLSLNLPEGDYETLAGFILSVLGHIPHEGEQIAHDSFQLVVSEMAGVKIETVTVIAKPPAKAQSQR